MSPSFFSFLPTRLQPTNVALFIANRVLANDAWAVERLAEFSGRTIRVVVGPIEQSVSIQSDGTLHPTDASIVPDVILSLAQDRLAELPKLLRAGEPSAIAKRMHIQGDAGVAALVSELAQRTTLDVEAGLARVVGDIAAVRLVQGAKQLVSGLQQGASRAGANLGEYLGEESQILVSQDYFPLWQDRLAQLNHQLNQTEHRLQALEAASLSAAKGQS